MLKKMALGAAFMFYVLIFTLVWTLPFAEIWPWVLITWLGFVGALRAAMDRDSATLAATLGGMAWFGSLAVFPRLSPSPYATEVFPTIFITGFGGVVAVVTVAILETALQVIKRVAFRSGEPAADPSSATVESKPARFQFTLKTLLLVVFLVSLPLSWLAFVRARVERQRELLVPIQRFDPTPSWGAGYINSLSFSGSPSPSDDDLGQIVVFTRLRFLFLDDCAEVTDAGLVHISKLKDLEYLSIIGTQISARSVEELRRTLPDCDIRRSPSEVYWLEETQTTPQEVEE